MHLHLSCKIDLSGITSNHSLFKVYRFLLHVLAAKVMQLLVPAHVVSARLICDNGSRLWGLVSKLHMVNVSPDMLRIALELPGMECSLAYYFALAMLLDVVVGIFQVKRGLPPELVHFSPCEHLSLIKVYLFYFSTN